MNRDLVIWTQPSGPLCLWQCLKETFILSPRALIAYSYLHWRRNQKAPATFYKWKAHPPIRIIITAQRAVIAMGNLSMQKSTGSCTKPEYCQRFNELGCLEWIITACHYCAGKALRKFIITVCTLSEKTLHRKWQLALAVDGTCYMHWLKNLPRPSRTSLTVRIPEVRKGKGAESGFATSQVLIGFERQIG